MASTITVARTIATTQNWLKGAPLLGVQGNPLEPGLTIADSVRQFILAPPFPWRWNRSSTTFNTVQGTQDYSKALSTFGWLEKASRNDNLSTSQSVVELENRLIISEDNAQGPPYKIAAMKDDDAGNIVFRLHPIPDAIYTVTVNYQNASPVFSNITDTWAPIPDYMHYLYDYGFRALAYDYYDDPRFAWAFQMFLKQLMAANEGRADTQKNIFLEDHLISLRQQQSETMGTQIGRQSRGGVI